MDLNCVKCGEPYDFHEFETHAERKRFMQLGCGAIEGVRDCGGDGTELRAIMARAAFEVCGDDLDGVAAMLDDF